MSINEVLAEADNHLVSDDGDHLINLDWVKSTWKDLISFKQLIDSNPDEYFWLSIDDDGTEETLGYYQDNPFSVASMHTIDYDESLPAVEFGAFSVPQNVSVAKAVVQPLSNDHTCIHCGNIRCSKQEKTCWKCGMKI